MNLKPQAFDVLQALKFQYNVCKIWRLAHELGIPEASVRRSIHELRRFGHHITVDFGIATLVKPRRNF